MVPVALALHLGPRDRWRGLDALHYATPVPVIAVLSATLAWAWWRRAARGRATAALLVALGCAVGHASTRMDATPRTTSDATTTRIALWNVARGMLGWDDLPAELAQLDADVLCLVESKGLDAWSGALERHLPQHDVVFARGGFTLLSRVGDITIERLSLSDGKALRAYITRNDASVLRIILADVPAILFTPRARILGELTDIARVHNGAPTLLLGDFNTPRTSVWFEPLRTFMSHTFEAAGSGFAETWPAPAPFLDLDHIWCNHAIEPLAAHTKSAWCSDHSAVIVDMILR